MHTKVRSAAGTDANTPDHLRIFRDRMAEAGIRVRLPVQPGEYVVPELVKLPGQPVSEIVIESRYRSRD